MTLDNSRTVAFIGYLLLNIIFFFIWSGSAIYLSSGAEDRNTDMNAVLALVHFLWLILLVFLAASLPEVSKKLGDLVYELVNKEG